MTSPENALVSTSAGAASEAKAIGDLLADNAPTSAADLVGVDAGQPTHFLPRRHAIHVVVRNPLRRLLLRVRRLLAPGSPRPFPLLPRVDALAELADFRADEPVGRRILVRSVDCDDFAVLDRDTPVAQLIPVRESRALRVRKPAPGSPPPNRIKVPKRVRLNVDIVALLLEERRGHR